VAESPGTFEAIVLAVGKAFAPLGERLKDENALDLFAELGVRFPGNLLAQPAFKTALDAAVAAIVALPPVIVQLETAIAADDVPSIVDRAAALANGFVTAITKFDDTATALSSLAGSIGGFTPGDVGAFAATLANKLIQYALVTYLDDYHPLAAQLLQTIGVVDKTVDLGVAADPAKPAHLVRSLVFARLPELVSSPGAVFKKLYGWNDPGFDGRALLQRLYELLYALGFPAAFDTSATPPRLRIEWLEIDPDLGGASPHGVRITLRETLPAIPPLEIPLTAGGVELGVAAAFPVEAGVSVVVAPPFHLSVLAPGGPVSGTLTASIHKEASGSERLLILGARDKSRLDAQHLAVSVAGLVDWDGGSNSGRADLDIVLEANGAHVVVDLGDADGFLKSVIPSGGIDATFDAAMGWSSTRGLFFRGSANLETTFPLNLDAFGLSLKDLHLRLSIPAGAFALEASVSGGVALGPFEMTIDRVGATSTLTLQRGNLGLVDLSFGFKPPNGLGVRVDAGLVAGGGYIAFDSVKGQYAGAFELSLLDVVTVKVIGILDTRYPDGTSGFSFLLVITTDFPPVQLGFGFTLNGVGGTGGINRTLAPDALRAGLRAHRLDSVLFPPDPVGNAPQIISDLSAYFPPARERYIFGPMLSLGWGTPTLIDLEVGVILEVPNPIKIAILGLIKAALPDEDVALIELHIDVLGVIDFGAGLLTIQGSMYDSRVVIFSVFGGMALMVDWGAQPNFAFSAGGLNPRFQPPPGFPQLDRLTVSIGDGDNPRLSSRSYFAVTSNSVQFGANVDLYAEAAGFSVHGWVGFDALFILSPFSFVIDFTAGLDLQFEGVSFASIRVDGMLAGPSPWHVHGDASLHILFITISASIDLVWGDDKQATLPPVAVLDTLLPALKDPRSWSAALPDGAAMAVSLGQGAPDATLLLVHPMGSLTVRENVVPLDLRLTKFGNAKPSDGQLFSIQAVTINGVDAEPERDLLEHYAIGQFTDLSDADKITATAYQNFHSGKIIDAGGARGGTPVERDVVYDEKYIDDYGREATFIRYATLSSAAHFYLSQSSASAYSAVKTSGPQAYKTPGMTSAIATSDVAYVIASTLDLSVRTDLVAAHGTSQLEATLAMRAHIAANPAAAGTLQVLPFSEVAA
jgi:hypothetical protein